MILHRRSFLVGLGASLFAAPAIVRAASIMPVKAMPALAVLDAMQDMPFVPPMTVWDGRIYQDGAWSDIVRTSLPAATWRKLNMGVT